MTRGIIIVAAVASSLCGGGALAQDTPTPNNDAAAAMTGAWELSNADHDKTCHFVFRSDAVPGGFKIEIDKNCATVFPTTRNIIAWAMDGYGNLSLLDAQGNAVIELTEVESGIYDGFTPEDGRYILQSAATAAVHSAADMAGDWAIARGTGNPICRLTLANTAATGTGASPDTFGLRLKPGCDVMVTRFGPTAWRMDQGELVLLAARGQSWRFVANDANTWQREPETADPVLLVRQ
jgi:hypothetical protein